MRLSFRMLFNFFARAVVSIGLECISVDVFVECMCKDMTLDESLSCLSSSSFLFFDTGLGAVSFLMKLSQLGLRFVQVRF